MDTRLTPPRKEKDLAVQSYASAHLWYAHSLSMRKRHEEALREVRRAQQLDPLSPIIHTQVGWILQHAGRHGEAIEELRKVLAEDPDYVWALWRIGSSYASKSMFQEGIDALEKVAKLSGRSPAILGTLADDSQRVLEWLEKAYQQREQGIAWLAVWEAHGPYRSDPRFHELIQRTGLAEK